MRFRQKPRRVASRSTRRRQFRAAVQELEDRVLLSLFSVNAADDVNDGLCDATHCSLREAILAANAAAGDDDLQFSIDGGGVPTIHPTSELPTVTDPVQIDGTTQAAGMVELDGSGAGGGSDGLVVVAGTSTIRGLVINRFAARGIVLARNGGNRIEGNRIGTDALGTADLGNGAAGVLIADTAGNIVGGPSAEASNLISGNGQDGVAIYGSGVREFALLRSQTLESDGQVVDPDGDCQVVVNQRDARITVPATAHDLSAELNMVNAPRVLLPVNGDFIAEVTVPDALNPQGDSTLPERVPFNGTGVLVWQDAQNYARLERAAFIRDGQLFSYVLFELRENGQVAFARTAGVLDGPVFLRLTRRGGNLLALINQGDSFWVTLDPIPIRFPAAIQAGVAAINTASTPFPARLEGFSLFSLPAATSARNAVMGNGIGVDVAGQNDLGNSWAGVAIYGSDGNTVGGSAAGARNLISGNDQNGIRFANGSSQNVVQGNFVGTNGAGISPLRNALHGVAMLSGAHDNLVGTNGDGFADGAERNVLAGNGWAGVGIVEVGTNGNVVSGNFIGTDVSGSLPLGNDNRGVDIYGGAQFNVVGAPARSGSADRFRNIISANGWDGVGISGTGTNNNSVAGNFIGTDPSGLVALGNVLNGASLFGGASFNRIGTDGDDVSDASERNLISGNLQAGVAIQQFGTDSNIVAGNWIGTDATGMRALGNGQHGVAIFDSAFFNSVGANGAFHQPAQRNVISGNGWSGVSITNTGVTNVHGNFIGLDAVGAAALGNGADGITIWESANNNIGGGFVRNVISGNQGNGVLIRGPRSTGNTLEQNFIGTDVSGSLRVGNALSGVAINGGSDNRIGGTNVVSPNLISGNGLSGIVLENGANRNLVQSNTIGTNFLATNDLGNARDGVLLRDAPANTIGGVAQRAGNLISGNDWNGVSIQAFDVLGGAVGWWRAESNADDFLGEQHGVLRNGAGFDAGRVGAGFQLDGVDDHIELGPGASLAGQGPFSVEVWLKTTDVEGSIVQQRQPDTPNELGYNGEFVLSIGNILGAGGEGHICWVTFGDLDFGFQFCSNRVVNDGFFHHIVAVREPDGTGRIYIDGFLDNSQVAPARTLDPSLRVVVGSDVRDNLHYLSGLIDEVLIFSRNLGPEAIDAVFNAGSAGRGDNLVAGNFIGTDGAGTRMIRNTGNGVSISDSPSNVIGGTEPFAHNFISGNGGSGVAVIGSTAVANQIIGNRIGIDQFGQTALGNGMDGLLVLSDRNEIGGESPESGNVIAANAATGVSIGGRANRVRGNFIGTDATGSIDLGNALDGIVSGGFGTTIGGTTSGARNIISGNGGTGVHLLGSNHVVQGNYIGTNAAGTIAIGNGDGSLTRSGIVLNGAAHTLIGGTIPGSGNLVSGNHGNGIRMFDGTATGNVIQGNRIGVSVAGVGQLGNQYFGILADGRAIGNTIGGTALGAANVLAFNGRAGIGVLGDFDGTCRNIAIIANSVFSNATQGIALDSDGVTPNDRGDRDAGGNDRQNFPTLKSLTSRNRQMTLRGSLKSMPSTTYRIEFFDNDSVNQTGKAEGQRFLGAIEVRTNVGGTAVFAAIFPETLAAGHLVTATATDPAGNTSEFSGPVRVPGHRNAISATIVHRNSFTAASTADTLPLMPGNYVNALIQSTLFPEDRDDVASARRFDRFPKAAIWSHRYRISSWVDVLDDALEWRLARQVEQFFEPVD